MDHLPGRVPYCIHWDKHQQSFSFGLYLFIFHCSVSFSTLSINSPVHDTPPGRTVALHKFIS